MKSNREENPPVADGDERVAGVAAVNRALSILEAFTVESPTLSLVELSEKTGLYKSTILRLIESLESFGYIQRSSAGSYVVGAAPLRLAAVARNDLHPAEKIMPALRALAERTRESASFYVRSGDKRLCAYRVDSPRSIRDHVQPGQLLPLNVGAAGHVLQIFADPARDPDLFRRRIVTVSLGERDSEAAAMASPVFGPASELEGAVTLSGPIGRFNRRAVIEMSEHLLNAARLLTIGFQGDPRVFDEWSSAELQQMVF